MIVYFLNVFFVIYNFLIIIRLLGSWIPDCHRHWWFKWTTTVTDPYLNLFKGWIPIFFGMDFSPMIAMFVLQLVIWLLTGLFQ